MSRKKTIITKDILFVNNINKIVDENGGKYSFADAIGVSYDAVRQWCIGENLPDGKRLMAIRDKFGVSIDWLLAGTEPEPVMIHAVAEEQTPYNAEEMSMTAWPEEVRRACRQLKTIMLSNHPVIKPALMSNLAAFEYSVEQEASHASDTQRLEERIQDLEERSRAERFTGTVAAASSNTGRRKT